MLHRKKRSVAVALATIIITSPYSQHSLAGDLISQCILDVPSYNRPLVQDDNNQLPITIHSYEVKGNYPNEMIFTGKVDIQKGNSHLLADKVHLHQHQQSSYSKTIRTIDALGNVHYDDDRIIVKGSKAWSNLDTKDTNIWNSSYLMVGRQGRGTADKVKIRHNGRYIIFENSTFTSCLPGNNNWSIASSKLIQDCENQIAEIWNARFKIGSIPVFYSPYLRFPIVEGENHYSNFLIPNVKYSNDDGIQFIVPWYWNITPQVDYTITPSYLSKRNLQWRNKLHYLNQFHTGLVVFDYLPKDKQYNRDKTIRNYKKNNSQRWLFFWRHAGVYWKHWRVNANYIKVSDPYYFQDFDSKYFPTTEGYTPKRFSISYTDANWDATLSSKCFQVLSTNHPRDVYCAPLQFDFNHYINKIGPFNTHLYAKMVQFTNVNHKLPGAIRLHLEPTIDLTINNNWGSINTEAKLLATHYQQSNIDYYNSLDSNSNNQLKKNVNRIIPQFKVDGRMVFDRSINWGEGYTQTLNPRVQYLYIQYRDQSHIRAYDATLLQTDYTGLFRDRIYSGLDRIASANQLASGLATCIYDSDLVERFNLSIGQIYSFTPHRTGLDNINNEDNTGSLTWVGDTYCRISNHLGIRGSLQYEAHLDTLAKGNAVFEYCRNVNQIMQLNYRYSNVEYVTNILDNNISNKTIYKNGISQVGVAASWPIADLWEVVGAYYYDIKNKQLADQLLGIQYSSCCYTIRIGYERKINGLENNNNKYNNQISFNIELRGLSQNYSVNSNQILRSCVIPYQNTF